MKTNTYYYLLFLLLSFSGYAQNTLEFTYDNAGNQIYRDLDEPHSIIEQPAAQAENSESLAIEEMTTEELENLFTVSPNPTANRAVLSWKPEIAEHITSIELVSLVTSEKKPVAFSNKNTSEIDLTGKITGIYLILFHLNNPETPTVQKKIVKL